MTTPDYFLKEKEQLLQTYRQNKKEKGIEAESNVSETVTRTGKKAYTILLKWK